MISVVHTGGSYTVIQVKYRRDINLKLSVFFYLALIRLHDALRTYVYNRHERRAKENDNDKTYLAHTSLKKLLHKFFLNRLLFLRMRYL